VLKNPADAATLAEVRALLDKLAADPPTGSIGSSTLSDR
jgi:hypothetical protein